MLQMSRMKDDEIKTLKDEVKALGRNNQNLQSLSKANDDLIKSIDLKTKAEGVLKSDTETLRREIEQLKLTNKAF